MLSLDSFTTGYKSASMENYQKIEKIGEGKPKPHSQFSLVLVVVVMDGFANGSVNISRNLRCGL